MMLLCLLARLAPLALAMVGRVQAAPLLATSHRPTQTKRSACRYAGAFAQRVRALFYFSLIDVERVGQVGQWVKASKGAGFCVLPAVLWWGLVGQALALPARCWCVRGTLPGPNPLIHAWR